MIEILVFYMFAVVLIGSAIKVVFSCNPVHSVLFLILTFFNAAGLCILLGAEFIAMMLVIVYVGAVAVLFLFVVMMLDINLDGVKRQARGYTSIGGLIAGILLIELIWMYQAWPILPEIQAHFGSPTPDETLVSNTHALGEVLYTQYVYLFQVSGLILLVAMVGAITLTLRTRPNVRKQKISRQVNIKRDDVIEIKKVETGAGVS